MSLASSTKYLAERGITVKELAPYRHALSVAGKRSSTLEEHEGRYFLRCWDFVPGPAPADFIAEFSDLDAALLVTWYFYFGEPVLVGEWRVALHEHPAWSMPKLAWCVSQAISVTPEQFESVGQSRRAERGAPAAGEGRYAVAMRTQFIACPSVEAAARTLMLRRDLEEAYVVVSHS